MAGPKQVPKAIVILSLGSLRCHWHRDMSLINQRFHPPLAVPAKLVLRPFFWRQFWSLELPSNAFIPWWWLLQNRIGYRSFLHRINPIQFPTPSCGLCGEHEDLYHFVIDCEYKSWFWSAIVNMFSLHNNFPTNLSIWSGLVILCSMDSIPLDSSVLVILGTAFSSLWKYHWRCIIDEEQWRAATILDSFKIDNAFFISSWAVAAGDNTSAIAPLS